MPFVVGQLFCLSYHGCEFEFQIVTTITFRKYRIALLVPQRNAQFKHEKKPKK